MKTYGPTNLEFAAHIGLYTGCFTLRDDTTVAKRPIRLFHGTADNWVSIEACRAYVARLKNAGADAVLTEYPGATHVYDAFYMNKAVQLPQAQSVRDCSLAEGDGGVILNAKTGAPFVAAVGPQCEVVIDGS